MNAIKIMVATVVVCVVVVILKKVVDKMLGTDE